MPEYKRNRINYFMKNTDESYFSQEYSSNGNPGKKFVSFIIGMAILCTGIFLIFQNTIITTNFSLLDLLGFNPPFGLVLLPLLLGIGTLFFNGRSVLGWILTIFGLITILLGILMGLRVFFKPVTLYQGILMFGMTSAGVGLMFKAFSGRKG